MPRQGITMYDLLISCPGDVAEYISVIKECVESFNKTIGAINNSHIESKHWSTDSYPQSGDKPQELLNKQFVRDCDAAVAIFWTRFGTPTDKYGSGTEEEIEEMLSANKQVFIYFIDAPINPSSLDTEQYRKINEFKSKYQDQGIYYTAKNEDELRKLFTNHLTMHFLPIIMGTKPQILKPLSSALKIYDKSSSDKVSIWHTNLAKSTFIEGKKQGIIREINELNQNFLPKRKTATEKKDFSTISSEDLKSTIAKITSTNNIYAEKEYNVDISGEWKSRIIDFVRNNGIDINEEFWNIGNLKKSSIFIPSALGGGTSLRGTEEEKKRYTDIEDLYFHIEEYNDFLTLFSSMDSQNLISLILSNTGNTFDEDIDVKLIFNKGTLTSIDSFLIPEMSIIEETLELELLQKVYMIKTTDTIDEYDVFAKQYPELEYIRPVNIFGPSIQDEYESNVRKYKSLLNRIFCYKTYEKGNQEIISFHVDYLKHNRSIAFPSVIVLDEVPGIVEYEITSKHFPEIIKGKIDLT